MAAIESKDDPKVQLQVDRTFSALRSSLRPLEYVGLVGAGSRQGGHYRLAVTSGLTTVLNANDRILSIRWTDPDRFFVLKRLAVAASIQTAFGAAQENAVDLVKLTGFTASDGGGTAVALGSAYKAERAMADSAITDMRVASATAVTAGTSTVNGIIGRAALNLANTAGSATPGEVALFDHMPGSDHPLVLGANEGLNARIAITQGAAGVVRFVFTLDWAEIPFEY